MTTTKTAVSAVYAISDYVRLDAQIKLLEEARSALKATVLTALARLGDEVELPDCKVKRVCPMETVVDLAVLRQHTSARVFGKVVRLEPDLDMLRKYIGAEKLKPEALAAITYEPGTPHIRIYPR